MVFPFLKTDGFDHGAPHAATQQLHILRIRIVKQKLIGIFPESGKTPMVHSPAFVNNDEDRKYAQLDAPAADWPESRREAMAKFFARHRVTLSASRSGASTSNRSAPQAAH
jgi:hypothetical protein